jgi:peptidoglycan/LPS O-acetylase OafA/YrhL
MSASAPRLPYRPGVDGLRTVAVAAVLLYHGGVPWTPGGFLGVDIFLVISGYLITSLLLAERRSTGSIALPRFWLRRARRLLPASLLVIAVCLLLGATVLRSQLGVLRGDGLASLLYVMNWHEVFSHRSYFEAFARPSLLRHFWSLSLEEQFYLIWPPVLLGVLAIARRGRIVIGLAVAAMASVVLMAVLFDPHADPSRVYFGTDTRCVGLLVGALLAFAWDPARLTTAVGPGAGNVLDAVGGAALALLLAVIWRTQEFSPWLYRGGFAVVAVLTAIVIAVLVHPAARLGAVLGWGPLRWLGLRSYGIYLWHWPVIALTRPDIDVHMSRWILVPLQAAAAVGLAALSYRFVEQPVRRGTALPWLRSKLLALQPTARWLTTGGAAALAVGLLAFVLLRPSLAPSRASAIPGSPDAAAPPAPPTKREIARLPAPKHGAILAVGESVMLGASSELEKRLGPRRLRIDATVGRQAADMIATLRTYRQGSGLPSRVIVQIGDNGPILGDQPDQLKAALKGVRRVVLVTVHVPERWQDPNNAVLHAMLDGWPQARLADWNSIASAHPGYLVDGVHANTQGRAAYAKAVAAALKAP